MIFDLEIQNQIIQKYKEDQNIEQLTEKYKCKECDIRKILKENNLDRSYGHFSEELRKRIKTLYLSGKTYLEIRQELLISENGVRNTLKRLQVPKRSVSECNRKYKRNQHYFDSIDTAKKAYILGLLYSDGSNNTQHNSIVLSLQESDVGILEKIKDELEYEGPLYFCPLREKNSKYKNQYRLCINDEYMSSILEEKGVIDNKSLLLTFPSFIPNEFLPAFVCGYFDGDGCVYYDSSRDKYQTVTVGTRRFCQSLSNLLSSWDIKHSIKHPKQCKEETVVLQTCGNKSSYLFLSKIYENSPFHIDRKYSKYLSLKQSCQNKSYSN